MNIQEFIDYQAKEGLSEDELLTLMATGVSLIAKNDPQNIQATFQKAKKALDIQEHALNTKKHTLV